MRSIIEYKHHKLFFFILGTRDAIINRSNNQILSEGL